MTAGTGIALGILAGGHGSRLGGADKAWLLFRGETLIARALRAFPGWQGQCLVSHPGDARLAALGMQVAPDLRPGRPGPLAGLEALLTACSQPWLLTLPVDLRDIPPGLAGALELARGRDGVVVRDGDGRQPLVGLWRVAELAPRVAAALDAGEAAVHRVLAEMDLAELDISPWRLGNLNTPADFTDTAGP